MAAKGTSRSPIVISDDDEPVVVARMTLQRQKHRQLAEGSSRHDDAETRRPEWLPGCFTVGVERRCSDGTVILNYTCPAGFTFNSRPGVEEHCSSGALKRALDSKTTLDDISTLQGKYQWLREYPHYVLEIRAGGKNLSKMFKFYANPSTGVRIASKTDFMRYVCDGVMPKRTNKGCDTSGEDNIIAQLEFLVHGLPPGWVKETAFRHYSHGIRTDPFFTDPITGKVFRSLSAAIKYFRTGILAACHGSKQSVTDMYFFDNYTNMHPSLAKRLKTEDPQNSCRNQHGTSTSVNRTQRKKPKTENKMDEDAVITDANKPSRPKGRPRKS